MSTLDVQAAVGIPQPSDVWDTQTESALRNYQGRSGLRETGQPDPQTLASLNLVDPYAGLSAAQKAYVDGGEEPGHFGRDFSGAMNQIPRWGWLTTGVAFLGLGWFSWYRRGRGRSR